MAGTNFNTQTLSHESDAQRPGLGSLHNPCTFTSEHLNLKHPVLENCIRRGAALFVSHDREKPQAQHYSYLG